MQLLRGFPWCHLNSALPPVFSIHLSACVPKHFCLMTSSLCFSQFRPLADPPVFGFFFFLKPARPQSMLIAAWAAQWRREGLGSELAVTFVNSHFSLLLTEKGTTWPARTHRKVWAGIGFWQALPARPQPDCQGGCSSVDLCARVHECYCQRFPERPLEQNGQIPGIFFLILARGKVRRVSIHRHEALEAISLKTGQRSGQMTCTAEQSSFGMGAGEKEAEGRRKYE